MKNLKALDKIIAYTSSLDTGAITAYQSTHTDKENQLRNRRLLAKLMLNDYGVTSIKGSFFENHEKPNSKEIFAEIFFVVDLKNKAVLRIDLGNLSQEFGLDFILYIPKGSRSKSEFLSEFSFMPFVLSEEISELISPLQHRAQQRQRRPHPVHVWKPRRNGLDFPRFSSDID